MTLSLTLQDNADGSGALATIAGSDVSSTNTVYAARVDLVQGTSPWTARGSRTGDGTLSLPLTPAYYWAYATGTVASAAAQTPPAYFLVSWSTDSVQEQVEAAVQARLQGLILTGFDVPPGNLPPERVMRFPALVPEVIPLLEAFPCIVVSTAPQPETQEGGTNSRDDIGYPVLVTLLDRSPPLKPAPSRTYRLWRQQAFRSLRHQRLAGIPTVYEVRIEPAPVLSWHPEQYELVYSALTVRAVSREPRGV